jgi:phosphoribosylformylglycinamidine cyclo-ligase
MQEARLPQDEMLRTFNCGIGMILVVAARDAERVKQILGPEAMAIGAIGKRGGGEAIRYAGAFARSAL